MIESKWGIKNSTPRSRVSLEKMAHTEPPEGNVDKSLFELVM